MRIHHNVIGGMEVSERSTKTLEYQATAATTKLCSIFEVNSTSIASLKKLNAEHKAFVRNNMPLPYSASVQRVFSVTVDIFSKK